MKDRIYLCLAHMSGREMDYIKEAFDTNWVVPLGPNVDGFEKELEAFLGGGRYVSALSSGTAAIHLALLLAGVGVGDEVICQSFTFAASANPILYQGARPVFVDSEEDTWNMSPQLLQQAIEERIGATGRAPKAIIVVHLYGMPAKMDEIMAIARNYGIAVIEDAAEALGSLYGGAQCGTMGNYGILSFNGNKMITTSGGGALVCPSMQEKQKAVFYSTQAREPFPHYQHEHIGYNYRMSNICAGIGRGQMTVLSEHIAWHRHTAELYSQLLADVEGVTLHLAPGDKYASNYWLNTVLIDKEVTGKDREQLRLHLDAEGIETRPLWKPMHLQPVHSGAVAYVNGVSERLFDKGLCLPSGPCVSDDDIYRIVGEIKRCFSTK
ncbi:MAG: DegT/DnrJ/EryC1/StrS family aminotransferase [Bacteroidaceae bacterium]|nr:DegT/DnrJ/EryC1/StrS family aminotransferase [Bacteroidaceae bacterium]